MILQLRRMQRRLARPLAVAWLVLANALLCLALPAGAAGGVSAPAAAHAGAGDAPAGHGGCGPDAPEAEPSAHGCCDAPYAYPCCAGSAAAPGYAGGVPPVVAMPTPALPFALLAAAAAPPSSSPARVSAAAGPPPILDSTRLLI